MTEYYYFLFFSICLFSNSFSQDIDILTEFSQDGILYKSLDESARNSAQFKTDEKCSVLEYLGKDKYKVRYNEFVGFVDSQYLVINEDMMDLFYAYQETERLKAIESDENRKEEIQEIIRKSEAEKSARADSILKVKEDKKRQQELQEIARKRKEELNQQRRADSIVKVKEEERRQQEELQEISRKKQEELNQQRRADSIVKVKEEERRQQEELQEISRKKQEELNQQRRADSIVKVKEEERIQQEKLQEISRKNQEELNQQRREDSIVKVNAEEAKRQQEELREIARKKQEELNERRREDSIVKIKEEEKRQQELREIARKNQEKLNQKTKEDSILKIKENEIIENRNLERIEFRNTCHYAMNEFDIFDKIKIIRTDPYKVAENLTIELYKRGQSKQVFFNLSEDLGCASYLPTNRSYVKVKLENNKVITVYHSWDIDCGNFGFKGNLSNSQIVLLEKSPIKSIWFKGTKNFYEITNVDYKEFFMDTLKCLD
tara:strand:+ start:4246 stop:5724 length:1479 start_codon:yes stop_codon:yes gene_type:complete